jgi:hypothetical protein
LFGSTNLGSPVIHQFFSGPINCVGPPPNTAPPISFFYPFLQFVNYEHKHTYKGERSPSGFLPGTGNGSLCSVRLRKLSDSKHTQNFSRNHGSQWYFISEHSCIKFSRYRYSRNIFDNYRILHHYKFRN